MNDTSEQETSWMYEEGFLAQYWADPEKPKRGTRYRYRRYLLNFAMWVVGNIEWYKNDSFPLDPSKLTSEIFEKYYLELRDGKQIPPSKKSPKSKSKKTDSKETDSKITQYAQKSRSTIRTYAAALNAYIEFLWRKRLLPDSVHVPEVKELAAYYARRAASKRRAGYSIRAEVNLRTAFIPQMVRFYDTQPLPPLTKNNSAQRLSVLRNRALMALLFSSAIRIHEAAQLNRTDVQPGIRNLTIYGKGGKEREVWIESYALSSALAYLQERTDNNIALFVSLSANSMHRRLSVRSLRKIVKVAAVNVGAPVLSPHDIRHYRATMLLRGGMRLETLQEYLGHDDIGTTRKIYAKYLGSSVVWQELDNAGKASNPYDKDFDLEGHLNQNLEITPDDL